MNVSLSAETPMVCRHFYPFTLVLIFYSSPWSIQWNGCGSRREVRLYNAQPDPYFPSMQDTEVKLRADIRYGPDDPTLWPQPWVGSYCHLGAILRMPNDPNDILSIMWWDPTRDVTFYCRTVGLAHEK
jgi:hypothetical protein